jgi:hypothetical protein
MELFFSMALPAVSGRRPLIHFRNRFSETVGLLERMISPSQGRCLTLTQNKRIHTPNNHALSGIRTHDPSVRASEDSSCLRLRGYCDRLSMELYFFLIKCFRWLFDVITCLKHLWGWVIQQVKGKDIPVQAVEAHRVARGWGSHIF